MTQCGSKKILKISLDEEIGVIHRYTYTHIHNSKQRIRSSSDMAIALFQDQHFFLSPVPKENKRLTHKVRRVRIFTWVAHANFMKININ